MHLPVEDFAAVPARLLRPVHGVVGVAEHLLRVLLVARRAHGDADARRHVQLLLAQAEGSAEAPLDAPGHPRGAPDVGQIPHEQGELVATEARQRVAVAQQRLETLGDRHQELVSHGVAQGVVDGLEAIDVEEHDREAALLAPARATARGPRAARRTGSGWGDPVSASCNASCLSWSSALLASADVDHRARHAVGRVRPAVARQGAAGLAGALDPDPLAVAGLHAVLVVELERLAPQVLVEVVAEAHPIVGVDSLEPVLDARPDLLGPAADEGLPRLGVVDLVGQKVPVPDPVVSSPRRRAGSAPGSRAGPRRPCAGPRRSTALVAARRDVGSRRVSEGTPGRRAARPFRPCPGRPGSSG